MKLKILAILMAAGMASSVFAQSLILNNSGNSGGISATSNGRVFVNGTLFDGLNFNLGVTVSGGPDSGNLSSMGTFTQANDPKGYTGLDIGQFELGPSGAAVAVPGVAAGGPAFVRLQMWYNGGTTSLFPNYAAAAAGGGFVGDITFQNPVSNPTAQPPVPAGNLSAMPSINLLAGAPIPEPTTLALAGLGAASLLIFRRRK